MSRPELPRSSLGGGKPEGVRLLELAGWVVGTWELVWLVLLLSGASPQGQIWSVPGRWVAMGTRSLEHIATPGGWFGASWGVSRPVALGPVILVIVGLLVVACVAVHLINHGLPSRGPRRERSQRSGGSGGSSRSKEAAPQRRPTSLREFLDQQGKGEDD